MTTSTIQYAAVLWKGSRVVIRQRVATSTSVLRLAPCVTPLSAPGARPPCARISLTKQSFEFQVPGMT